MLATHDLEIRGPENFLGGQSGQIQKIGFSLFKDMLGPCDQITSI
ncbi:MAG: hypothetical protein Ct9H90mP13_08000 [Pseudomonadota bacterium]|nr:MAG: hypothetical protein Ct9H90mP13_08000 [Pseudomonadota bacterium]